MIKPADRHTANNFIKFASNLETLNKNAMVLQLRMMLLENNANFCASNTVEKVCPYRWGSPEYLKYNRDSINQILDQVRAINNTYALSQSGLALIREPQSKADFDLVAMEGSISPEHAKRSTFALEALPGEPMGPGGEIGIAFIPLIVYGAVAVTGLITGAVTATVVTDTISKKYDKEITEANIQAEKDMAKDPRLFDKWVQYKTDIQKPINGMIDNVLGAGTGKQMIKGAMGIGLVALAGFLLFRFLGRRK